MKIAALFGTRPEIIRLSQVIRTLDGLCELTLVHTGQNYDPNLSDVFFRELGVREPDIHFGIRAADFGEQAGLIVSRSFAALRTLQPDRLLVLGDTNSGLAALAAARLGIPVYHMEAGNRCYDDRVPEEVNRRVIDACSSVLLPYTHRSKENLVREGVDRSRIFVTGNPIFEVLNSVEAQISASDALDRLGLQGGRYLLATVHRAENVDIPARLNGILEGLARVARFHDDPVVVSLHPRTADKLDRFGMRSTAGQFKLLPPLGFFDFVRLEKSARCVLSDSGTVQEECCIFGIPNVTLRDVTERPETIECGSNVLAGADPDRIEQAARLVLAQQPGWKPPAEYLERSVAATVGRIMLGYRDAEAISESRR